MNIEQMAKELFVNNNPVILVFNEDEDLTYVFEVLINLSTEALLMISDINNYENLDLTTMVILNRWLRKIGYVIKLDVDDYANIGNYNDRYCKIIIRSDKTNEKYFEELNIQKNYHFLLNANNPIKNYKYLEDIYAILIQNGIIYKIHFNQLKDL